MITNVAFSCKQSLSPSLNQIINAIWFDDFKELNSDDGNRLMRIKQDYLKNKNNWNLEYLAQQGVLLYNPTLTVEAGKPNSHKGLWNPFTDAVSKSLMNKKELVWMMWGNDAKDLTARISKTIPIEGFSRLLLHNEHPAAASYRQEVWKCNHFTECNKWLRDKNLTEIEWIQR